MKKAKIQAMVSSLIIALLLTWLPAAHGAEPIRFKLGNEQLMSTYHSLIAGKKVGLVTNQSGVDSQGRSTIDKLAEDPEIKLTALYGPEHGIDGQAKAGEYVESYTHPALGIPVYSLYGQTRRPTEEMLKDVDVLLFDVQDIGARSYTYISTLNYCMVAAQKYDKPIIVLDRPNPLGGETVEGPVMEDPFITFVGVDNLPMAHGMTVGELARFFNRKIGAKLTVVPMEGYTRSMIFQDTGLSWVQTSPNIPDTDSVFGYMATGMGEGTGIYQADQFKWIGGKGIDAQPFADQLNQAGLPGVIFNPENRGTSGGVRLQITDYHAFNPAKTGIYALAIAHKMNNFKVPKSDSVVVMFDKIMGTAQMGQWLEQNREPQEIVNLYNPGLQRFKEERKQYLIYGNLPGSPPLITPITVWVDDRSVPFDRAPYIDSHDRVMVPLRAIVEALGATVDWDASNSQITVRKGNVLSQFTVGSTTALFNGVLKAMDTSPVILGDRTMVPARFVAESVGASVNWDGQNQSVLIRAK
ncbi:exo-beta-N-acetylmuramidase NamZ domain-containing protein [Heliobacterium chlorum]